jgi:hypothetical protein
MPPSSKRTHLSSWPALCAAALLLSACLPEGSGARPRADAIDEDQASTSDSTSGAEDTTSPTEKDTLTAAADTQDSPDTAADTQDPDTDNNINECLTNNGGCDPLTVCIDTPTSRACGPCPSGYLGLGDTGCSDINECANGTANCSPNADCTNTFGGYACDCKPGFQGDGITCELQVCGGLQCGGSTPYLDAQRCQCVGCLYSTHCGGNQCLSGTCSACTCPPGTTCQGNECVADGGCGGGCPSGSACINSRCEPTSNCASCPSGTSCDPVTLTCYTPGGACSTNADCRVSCGPLGICACAGALDTTSCRPDEVCADFIPGFGSFCIIGGSP